MRFGLLTAAAAAVLILSVHAPANAVDGCRVLLCLAAPDWRSIPECVPTIRQVLKDLAKGKMFPTCAMSGIGNSASHQWASAPAYCPPQYTVVVMGDSAPIYSCSYVGAVSVSVQGQLWARTWWGMSGDSVTEYTPAAKTALGTWDKRFEDDYSKWFASLPPPPPPCQGDC